MGKKIRVLKSTKDNSATDSAEISQNIGSTDGEKQQRNPIEWWAEEESTSDSERSISEPERSTSVSEREKQPDGEGMTLTQMNDYTESVHEAKPQKQPVQKLERESVHEKADHQVHSHRQKTIRAVLVACALVFTIMLSVCVGAGLALWDMEKTPSDLVAAISNGGVRSQNHAKAGDEDNGLTFIDPEEEEESSEDTGLTFIDANEPLADADDENQEDLQDETEKGNLDTSADAVTEAADGTIIVSSELSGVRSIMKAGSDEMLTVVAASQTSAVNPNEGYPLPFTAVDDSYFDDALFIGDSRFYGFMMWSGISGANYCATSFNIFQYETFKVVQTGNGKVPIFNALPYNAFTKIYIKVGLNEMGNSEEKFEAKYAEIIARLREMEPRAIIYIHAVLPVTAAKSASDRTHSNPNIIARNASLKQFARDQQCYFIDAGPVLSDESGCLKPEMTGDGIHLSSRYMGVWKQYLMENAVVVNN